MSHGFDGEWRHKKIDQIKPIKFFVSEQNRKNLGY